MHWEMVVAVVAIIAWVARGCSRNRYAYSIDSRRRSYRGSDLEAEREVQLLSSENERLNGQVSRLEERIAVLERIATDPATRIANEIERLR